MNEADRILLCKVKDVRRDGVKLQQQQGGSLLLHMKGREEERVRGDRERGEREEIRGGEREEDRERGKAVAAANTDQDSNSVYPSCEASNLWNDFSGILLDSGFCEANALPYPTHTPLLTHTPSLSLSSEEVNNVMSIMGAERALIEFSDDMKARAVLVQACAGQVCLATELLTEVNTLTTTPPTLKAINRIGVEALSLKQLGTFVKFVSARVDEARGRMRQAGLRYYELSQSHYWDSGYNDTINHDCVIPAAYISALKSAALQRAVQCCIMARDGDIFASRLQTEGPHQLPLTVTEVLKKVRLGHFLSDRDMERFEESMSILHRVVATMPNEALGTRSFVGRSAGLSQPRRSLVEHNIKVVSELYRRIRIEALAKKVFANRNVTEDLIASMIIAKQINGYIDHSAETVRFWPAGVQCLITSDIQIRQLTNRVNNMAVDRIS